MKPPPRFTLSQWADEERVLSTENSAEPGRWVTARAEYQRGIMDAISDPRIERVVLMTSARVGKTQVGNNAIGYHIDHDPCPIMAVFPTLADAENWSKGELAPMLRDTPSLAGRVRAPRSRDADNTIYRKGFPGGQMFLVGANSPSGLAAKTIRLLFCDEVDRYPASAGTEGDPVALAIKRTTTAWNRKIILASTPTIKGRSRIETAFLESDQRFFWVPCPECGVEQRLFWSNVRWDDGDPSTARYECFECDAGWTDVQRWAAVRRGNWRASAGFTRTAGFHLSELYSPWRRLSETVQDWLESYKDDARRKVFFNTALGETWEERGEAPDWERLIERREDFPLGVVPDEVMVLTAGVDVQDDRLECDIWGWGEGYSSWLIDHVVIQGGPRGPEPWDELARLLAEDWPRATSGQMRIAKVCVDTGGRDTAAVYGHLRRLRDHRIAPTKGVEGWTRAQPVQGPTPVDATVNGQKLRRGLKIWTVSVSTWKADLYRRLWLGRGDGDDFPAGWVHLPAGIEAEWVKQLVAEQLRTINDRRGFGRQEWAKLRERNEALDCAVLARAALWLLGADRYGDSYWHRLRGEAADAPVLSDRAVIQAPVEPDLPPAALIPRAISSDFRPQSWLGRRDRWLR